MDRSALIIYLRDVRDLEVIIHVLPQIIEKEEAKARREVEALGGEAQHERLVPLPERKMKKDETRSWMLLLGVVLVGAGLWLGRDIVGSLVELEVFLGMAVGLAICVVGAVVGLAGLFTWRFIAGVVIVFIGAIIAGISDRIGSALGGFAFQKSGATFAVGSVALVLFVVGAGLLVCWIFYTLTNRTESEQHYEKRVEKVQAQNREIEERNRREDERVEPARQRWEAWRERENQLHLESFKAKRLLKKYYAMNILPNQFRTLSSVCYVYDYMSSSQATLEDALNHQHWEDGIQRLEAKLDQVIDAIETSIYETRCLRAETVRLGEQNQRTLEKLKRIEHNTAETARYARLIECNTEATALFAAADYLSS